MGRRTSSVKTLTGSWSSLLGVGEGDGLEPRCARAFIAESETSRRIKKIGRKRFAPSFSVRNPTTVGCWRLYVGVARKLTTCATLARFAGLGLHGGDRDCVDDVVRFTAAREVVRRPIKALQNRPDRSRSR